MTIKEAIMLLNPKTTASALAEIEYYNGFSGKEACIEAIEDACRLAIEALEKQTPKKIVEGFETYALYDFNGKYTEQMDITSFRCPACKCVISSGEISKEDCIDIHYCDICGQAIDWSEEE